MRRSLYASGGLHAALILWVAVGDFVFRDSAEIDFEVTGVTILSTSEFEALTSGQAPTPEAPDAPAAEEAPPEVTEPEPTPEPEIDEAPEPTPPTPQAEVTDTIAPIAPPSGDPDLSPDSSPTPQEAPRIAPLPAPVPEPDVETAPDVVQNDTEPDVSDTPVEEQPETAPEEATTQTITEADDPSGGPLGPLASVRPTARPNRPEPVETADVTPSPEPSEPSDSAEPEDTTSAINDLLAEVVTDTPAAAAPSGPPLTGAARDGFRIAVQSCWNIGSLSTEAQQTTVVVAFDMARDGTPEAATLRMIEFTGGSEAAAQQAYEAARRAILRCGANGYDLPAESYDYWDQVELVFNPNGMRLR